MTPHSTPFDPTPFLREPAQIAAYLEDALASGSADVFADALEDVARAMEGSVAEELTEKVEVSDRSRVFEVQRLLNRIGLSIRFAPVVEPA